MHQFRMVKLQHGDEDLTLLIKQFKEYLKKKKRFGEITHG